MPAADPIIGMNLSSSQTELVQSGGLGHSGPIAHVDHIVIKIQWYKQRTCMLDLYFYGQAAL
jgi:hypothetical protein